MRKSIPDAEERNKRIGHQLQKYRQDAHITQEEMAAFCNISKNHISKIENGMCTCSAHLLIDYGVKLDVSLDTLAEFQPSALKSNVLPELQAKLENMSQMNQKKLLNILNILENE